MRVIRKEPGDALPWLLRSDRCVQALPDIAEHRMVLPLTLSSMADQSRALSSPTETLPLAATSA